MKRILSLLLVILIDVTIFNSCKPHIEEHGSIYGVITDKATGEPVKNVNVQLRPSGETTLTGNDGRYEFLDLKNGNYSIVVSKMEYTDLIDDYVITIDGNKAMRRDVQIEKIPAKLKILDSNGNEIEELDFGSMQDDNTRMFSVFNNSTLALEYEILETATWIMNISSTQGVLEPGATKTIVVNIDRTKLYVADNVTTITIVTNNGGKQLVVKANKAGDVSTKEAINITTTSAILCGVINKQVSFSEKGFYYGNDYNISNKKCIPGTNIGEFSYNLSGLQEGMTYFFKAYMILDDEVIFGELRSFKTTTIGDNDNDEDDDDGDDNDGMLIDLPTVTTDSVFNITETSVQCSVDVISEGGSYVDARGVCWSTTHNPTVDDNKTINGSGTGSFIADITGLNANTTYYVRSYAANSKGISYGEQFYFTTLMPSVNGHEYVDLGLPSGLKWATCNIGADMPEDYGEYFAWGETAPAPDNWYNDVNCSTYGVQMSDISGNPKYDAATANWGAAWRMPTKTEFEELFSNCIYMMSSQNGVGGVLLRSKVNGNCIFLPIAGHYSNNYLVETMYGFYWCSTPDSIDAFKAYCSYGIKGFSTTFRYRYNGLSVRPVIE